MLISFDSYGGWFGISSIEEATCKDLEKKAKGKKLTNFFGAKFKILKVKNSKEISRTKDKLVCIGDLRISSGFRNAKLLMTLINDDGQIWYEFKQTIDFTFDNDTENDSRVDKTKKISPAIHPI